MGTRGLYGFRYRGVDKTVYNQNYSYPDCLGSDMLEYCSKHDIETMKKIYDNIYLVNESVKPTQKDIDLCVTAGWYDGNVSRQTPDEWYCLLRNTQGDLSVYDSYMDGKLPMIDNHHFIEDSLFCEYAYIINLDDEVLEFWKGFQKKPQEGNRYGEVPDDGYYPCALKASVPLDQITSESIDSFIDAFNNLSEE